MSNPFDDAPELNGDGEAEDFEPDMATIAFLDQQQAEFGNMEEEFKATYGFEHNCHCGEDYANGRVGEITQCYHNMMQEALATCARLNAELKEMTGIAQALFHELRGRVEAEEGEGEVSDESLSGTAESAPVDTESESEPSGSADDSASADATGEGFGVAGEVTGNTGDEGTPADRKLI